MALCKLHENLRDLSISSGGIEELRSWPKSILVTQQNVGTTYWSILGMAQKKKRVRANPRC